MQDDKPTAAQHGFYRGEVLKAMAEYHYDENADLVTRNACHRYLAARFLGCEPDPITGEATKEDAARSTGKLTRRQFSNYISDCICFLAYYGIQVKDPSPVRHLKGVA